MSADSYKIWNNLVWRCSGGHKDACYSGVENRFESFDRFHEWCREQPGYYKLSYYRADGNMYNPPVPWELDKDLFGDGTYYGEDVCCFIPKRLNSILISRRNATHGTVSLMNSPKIVVQARDVNGVKRHVGSFETAEAAEAGYQRFKASVLHDYLTLPNCEDIPQPIVDRIYELYPQPVWENI